MTTTTTTAMVDLDFIAVVDLDLVVVVFHLAVANCLTTTRWPKVDLRREHLQN